MPTHRVLPSCLLAATLAASHAVAAQPLSLLQDLRPEVEAQSSLPQGFAALGARTCFAASDTSAAEELWCTDGTSAGTTRVVDLFPGNASSSPRHLTPCDGVLYFTAEDGLHGVELWKTDGTAADTKLVWDARPGSATSLPSMLRCSAHGLLFTVDLGDGMPLLHQTQGTAETSHLLTAEPLPPGDNAHNLVPLGGQWLFTTMAGALWSTSGEAAGTLDLGTPASLPLVSTTTHVNFLMPGMHGPNNSPSADLWRTNGMPNGLERVASVPGATVLESGSMMAAGAQLFFSLDVDGGGLLVGPELWTSDGTELGTHLVKDLKPGSGGSFPRFLGALEGEVFFAALDGAATHLWRSNGLAMGTRLTLPDVPLAGPMLEGQVFQGALHLVLNGSLVVVTSTMDAAVESPVSLTSIQALAAVGDRLFFSAQDGQHGEEPWFLERDVFQLLHNVAPEMTASAFPGPVLAVGSHVAFFAAAADPNQVQLWWTNGTAAGTSVMDTLDFPGPQETPQVLGDALFYAAWGRPGIGRVDASGWSQLVDGATSAPLRAGSQLFFSQQVAGGVALMVSDGTPQGTRQAFMVSGTNSAVRLWCALGSSVVFSINAPSGPEVLWVSDGSNAGTLRLANALDAYAVQECVEAQGRVVFVQANPSQHGFSLWTSNGTPSGTVELLAFPNVGANKKPGGLVAAGPLVFFLADDSGGREVWRTNGTTAGTFRLVDLQPGPLGSLARNLLASGSKVFFAATNGQTGMELWTSNGTAEGTLLVKDIAPGPASSRPLPLVVLEDGRVVLAAAQPSTGMELWLSDGTNEGTQLLQDIAPGVESSNPQAALVAHGALFVVANDQQSGVELWSGEVPAAQSTASSSSSSFSSASGSGPAQPSSSGVEPASSATSTTAPSSTVGPSSSVQTSSHGVASSGAGTSSSPASSGPAPSSSRALSSSGTVEAGAPGQRNCACAVPGVQPAWWWGLLGVVTLRRGRRTTW